MVKLFLIFSELYFELPLPFKVFNSLGCVPMDTAVGVYMIINFDRNLVSSEYQKKKRRN